MALFSMGVTMGPMLGPTLGGYLTDHYSWRWVFYVNCPSALSPSPVCCCSCPVRNAAGVEVQLYGFGILALAWGRLQLVLDRGQIMDWFTSREIMVLAVVAGLAFYLFLVSYVHRRQAVPSHRVVQGP